MLKKKKITEKIQMLTKLDKYYDSVYYEEHIKY